MLLVLRFSEGVTLGFSPDHNILWSSGRIPTTFCGREFPCNYSAMTIYYGQSRREIWPRRARRRADGLSYCKSA